MAKAITLPPELIDLIISFLVIPHKCRTSKSSQTTLYSCSLVCRQWRELARLHIFHTVALRFVHNEYGRITLEDFLIFLEATPHVPPCIRRLELDFFEGFIDESQQGILEKPPAGIDLVLLHAVLSRLPRLHSLLLGSVNPFNATPGDWAPTPIHLRYIDCNALGDILLFLEMFGNVDELVMGINQNYGSVPQVARRVAGLSHLRLRSLKLRASSCSPSHIASFTEGILLTPLLNTLDSLTLMNFNTEGSLAAARRLLRGVGPQLLGVCIYVSDQLATRNLSGFDLSACSRLESLTVFCSLYDSQGVDNLTHTTSKPFDPIRCILAQLAQVTPWHAPPCPRLRLITLTIHIPFFGKEMMSFTGVTETSTLKKAVLQHLEDVFIDIPALETACISLIGGYRAGPVAKIWERTNSDAVR